MYKKVVCFDLDDTLYKEIDFMKSGYWKVAELVEKHYAIDALSVFKQMLLWYNRGENVFTNLNEKYDINNPIEDYLNIYRYHYPSISLSIDVKETLSSLKRCGCIMGIISDGRFITQSQKIEALGLMEWMDVDYVFINEDIKYFKPNQFSYDRLMLRCCEQYPSDELEFFYIGDNPQKDFLTPNQLGWTSICLINDGSNIHQQDFNLPEEYLPQYRVMKLSEACGLILNSKE